jgi:hypothetical protein
MSIGVMTVGVMSVGEITVGGASDTLIRSEIQNDHQRR